MFKKRPDPATGGSLRWSLPYSEKCFCQGVVAPVVKGNWCPEEDEYAAGELFFADDHLIYELTMRHNWKKNKMDELLDRIELCGKSMKWDDFLLYIIYLFIYLFIYYIH